MIEETPVMELVIPEVGAIRPDDSIRNARRRMQSDSRRSLIVVDEDRPVGIVQWRDVQDVPDADALISTHMLRAFPVLDADMTMDAARARLGDDVDVDRLPVVGSDGRLVGEVPRETLFHHGGVAEVPVSEAGSPLAQPVNPATGTIAADATTAEQPEVRPGLDVRGSAGKSLGTVDQAIVDRVGRLSEIQVEHGLLFKKRKRIPADLIERVDDDGLTLTIDGTEFKMLPNLEDEPA